MGPNCEPTRYAMEITTTNPPFAHYSSIIGLRDRRARRWWHVRTPNSVRSTMQSRSYRQRMARRLFLT